MKAFKGSTYYLQRDQDGTTTAETDTDRHRETETGAGRLSHTQTDNAQTKCFIVIGYIGPKRV